MRTRRAIFMSKVRDNSAPKMILGMCWDIGVRSLAIPLQVWDLILVLIFHSLKKFSFQNLIFIDMVVSQLATY